MTNRETELLQRRIAREWKAFRQKYLFTQQDLATALGISRRAVAYVESGKGQGGYACIPQATTRSKFAALKAKHEREKK